MKTRGQVSFEVYSRAALPATVTRDWEKLPAHVQRAWEVVAQDIAERRAHAELIAPKRS